MKGFTVAEARARFGDLLDDAEQGRTVLIERRGVRFVLQAEPPASPRRSAAPLFEWLDPAVDDGQWRWDLTSRGATFRPRRARKSR